jgi:two-component system LytT family response regulator
MKDFEDMLVEQGFFRLHKSHIVNLSFVESYVKSDGGKVVLSDGTKIPVAERKKSSLLKVINKL